MSTDYNYDDQVRRDLSDELPSSSIIGAILSFLCTHDSGARHLSSNLLAPQTQQRYGR